MKLLKYKQNLINTRTLIDDGYSGTTFTRSAFVRLNNRYIAIMDNIDTNKGLNDFLPIQDWFNEMHAKNTSQKVRAVFKNKGNSGIPLN